MIRVGANCSCSHGRRTHLWRFWFSLIAIPTRITPTKGYCLVFGATGTNAGHGRFSSRHTEAGVILPSDAKNGQFWPILHIYQIVFDPAGLLESRHRRVQPAAHQFRGVTL
jgi:hypothetical protein